MILAIRLLGNLTFRTLQNKFNKHLYENQCNLLDEAIGTQPILHVCFIQISLSAIYILIINYMSSDFDGFEKMKVRLCPNEGANAPIVLR